MSRGVFAYIDSLALQHNLNRVKALAKSSRIVAMIKSNAYGHGLVRVARWLSEVDAFGVACLEEALALREAGITKPIMVMSGFLDQEELNLFLKHQLSAVVHQSYQVELLSSIKPEMPLSVWLKIDTGMHRLGFENHQIAGAYQQLSTSSSVRKPIGLMTHLADADNADDRMTKQQLLRFFQEINSLNGIKTIANSAAIMAYPNSHMDWVRPGIMLYGVSPFEGKTGLEQGLRPVMTFKARLIARKQIKKGDTVGYGCTWTAPSTMNIGVVAVGYGDGYPRHLPSGTPTLIRGRRCPLVGRVSMDMITVDLTGSENIVVGDEVVLWGADLPVEEIAKAANTIAYELLCGVTRRVKYIEY